MTPAVLVGKRVVAKSLVGSGDYSNTSSFGPSCDLGGCHSWETLSPQRNQIGNRLCCFSGTGKEHHAGEAGEISGNKLNIILLRVLHSFSMAWKVQLA